MHLIRVFLIAVVLLPAIVEARPTKINWFLCDQAAVDATRCNAGRLGTNMAEVIEVFPEHTLSEICESGSFSYRMEAWVCNPSNVAAGECLLAEQGQIIQPITQTCIQNRVDDDKCRARYLGEEIPDRLSCRTHVREILQEIFRNWRNEGRANVDTRIDINADTDEDL